MSLGIGSGRSIKSNVTGQHGHPSKGNTVKNAPSQPKQRSNDGFAQRQSKPMGSVKGGINGSKA
jgi:hypothetical protein